MKKIISKREYDTSKSELIKKVTVGTFGDPAGYEETLYKTEKGYFFLYVNGGEESPYTKEDIKCMSAKKATNNQYALQLSGQQPRQFFLHLCGFQMRF